MGRRCWTQFSRRKAFFFEKKKQKTFALWHARPIRKRRGCKLAKVFWFFFSKKNILSAYLGGRDAHAA